MELTFSNYSYKEKMITLNIKSGNILGITGVATKDLVNILSLKQLNKGQVTANNIKITKDNIYEYQRKIATIIGELQTSQLNILNLMKNYIKVHNLLIKDPIKKIKDSLKIVDLKEEILKRNIQTLSLSEKKLLQIAISLLSNPEILIIEEPFKCLDKYNEKKIVMLFQRLKEQFNKTIIIISNDSNILFKYTNNMIFMKDDEVILSGPTDETYLRVDYLKKNKFEIPDIVQFTYLAKKNKKVKIDYHKDIRDIIKDIYKHI